MGVGYDADIVNAECLRRQIGRLGLALLDHRAGLSLDDAYPGDRCRLVGSAEANPVEDKLSHESPIGKALMGRKRGEIVDVEVPRGPAKQLKITKIETA